MSDADSLNQALDKFQIQLTTGQIDLIRAYCQTLWDKNASLNLTRHTDFETFVSRDVVDSMHLAKHLRANTKCLDIGSGGGVPGILLAILRPDVNICLSEGVRKKAEALASMLSHLQLSVPVFNERAENVLQATTFHTLVARAVGPLAKSLLWFAETWDRFDELLLIKGPNWLEERKEARHRGVMQGLELRCIESYPMPGRETESVILRVWHKEYHGDSKS